MQHKIFSNWSYINLDTNITFKTNTKVSKTTLPYDSLLFKKYLSINRTLFTNDSATSHFYRAMHFSAKRGIAITCRLSVCLSVCL